MQDGWKYDVIVNKDRDGAVYYMNMNGHRSRVEI